MKNITCKVKAGQVMNGSIHVQLYEGELPKKNHVNMLLPY